MQVPRVLVWTLSRQGKLKLVTCMQALDDDQGGYLSRPELLQSFEEQGTRGASCSNLVNKIFSVRNAVGEMAAISHSQQLFE